MVCLNLDGIHVLVLLLIIILQNSIRHMILCLYVPDSALMSL